MKGAVETMMGIIMIAFMAVLSGAYIMSSLNTQRAQNYHSAVIAEIEAGDFSEVVIQSCKRNALENEYTDLEIELLISKENEKYAKVTLTYNYTLPVLNLFLEHQIAGYAR
ncbi:MAG: hypothetical protein QM793_15135 [Muricomes sp.]